MKLNKSFKKFIAVLCAFAMVVTSITVNNVTAKADDLVKLVSSVGAIDGVSETNTEAWVSKSDSAIMNLSHEFLGFLVAGIDHNGWGRIEAGSGLEGKDVLAFNISARGISALTVSAKDDPDTIYTLTNTKGTDDKSGDAMWDGDCAAISAEYFNIGDAEEGSFVVSGTCTTGDFSFTVVVKPYVYVANTDLNLKTARYEDKVAYLEWDLIDNAVKYEVYNADTGVLIKTSDNATLAWTNIDIEQGVTYNLEVKAIDADGNEIAITNNTTTAYQEIPTNYDMALGVVYGTGTATLSWSAITGAEIYSVVVDGVTVQEESSRTYTMDVEDGVTYNVTVCAYGSEEKVIEVTNNTKEVTYVAEGAPAEHDIANFADATWTKLGTGAANEYYINSDHTLAAGPWGSIYVPHSSCAYHYERTDCILGDAEAYVFQKSYVTNVWINGVKYGNPSTAFNNQGDCCELSMDAMNVGDNVVTLVSSDGSLYTFAIRVKGEDNPTDTTVDVTGWTDIPASGDSAAQIVDTWAMNTAGYTTYINSAIWGVVAVASETQYHAEICNLTGGAVTFATNVTVGNLTAVWINGKKYMNGSEKLHLREDSVEIATDLFAEGVTYVGLVGAASTVTVAVKRTAPQAEVAPDQTLATVTDWVKVGTTADELSRFYISEAFRNTYINYVDLFGLYADHTKSPYHQANCTLTGAAYVSSYPSLTNKIQSVWVDGVKYTSGTELCYIEGDQVHLAQSIFATDDHTYAVTVRTSGGDYTYAFKKEKIKDPTDDTISVDGWSRIRAYGASKTQVTGTWSMNTVGKETYVMENEYVWGVVADASETIVHDDATCGIEGGAVTFGIKDEYSAINAIWINGVRYVTGGEYVHINNHSIEISTALFTDVAEDETEKITYVGVECESEEFTVAIKYDTTNEADADPNQPNYNESCDVTDWVRASGAYYDENRAERSVYDTTYYMSDAYIYTHIPVADLLGLYDDHAKSLWHDQDGGHCTLAEGTAAFVFAFEKQINYGVTQYDENGDPIYNEDGTIATGNEKISAGTFVNVWIDGVQYKNSTEVCYLGPEADSGIAGSDQVHLAQSLFQLGENEDEHIFAVTIRVINNEGYYEDYTFPLKVVRTPRVTVTIDGVAQQDEKEDGKIFLGEMVDFGETPAEYGYYDAVSGKLFTYSEATPVYANADMELYSITSETLSVEMAKGAGIRYSTPTGIRFQANVSSTIEGFLESGSFGTGMLITTNDLYVANGEVTRDSEYTKVDIENDGWYNNTVGTYYGSLVNILEENYNAAFIARAYVTLTYENGGTTTVYSGMSLARSVSEVAQRIIDNDALNNYAEFVGATDVIEGFAAAFDGIYNN